MAIRKFIVIFICVTVPVLANSNSCKSLFSDSAMSSLARVHKLKNELDNFVLERFEIISTIKTMNTLIKNSNDQVNEIRNINEQILALTKLIEGKKNLKNTFLVDVEKTLAKSEELKEKIKSLERFLEIIENQVAAYSRSEEFRNDLKLLQKMYDEFSLIRGAEALAKEIRTLLVEDYQNISRVDISQIDSSFLTEARSTRAQWENKYDTLTANRMNLLFLLRQLTNQFEKYENFDSSTRAIVNEFIPQGGTGDLARMPGHELIVAETALGFKLIYVTYRLPTNIFRRYVALLDPAILVNEIQRGQFYNYKNYLYAVVGFFPNGDVLVERIKNGISSKLMRLSQKKVKSFHKLDTGNVSRPIIFGDTYYLKDRSYTKNLKGLLDYYNKLVYKKYHYEVGYGEGGMTYKTLFGAIGGVGSGFYLMFDLMSPVPVLGGLAAGVVYPLVHKIFFNDGMNVKTISGGPEIAFGSGYLHHNDYTNLIRKDNVLLDRSQFDKREQDEIPDVYFAVDSKGSLIKVFSE